MIGVTGNVRTIAMVTTTLITATITATIMITTITATMMHIILNVMATAVGIQVATIKHVRAAMNSKDVVTEKVRLMA